MQSLFFTVPLWFFLYIVGTFNGVLQATRHCMTVKDTLVSMDTDSEDDSDDERYNYTYL